MRWQRSSAFPFHQGRFQGGRTVCRISKWLDVSIPPRKVSRKDPGQKVHMEGWSFHSTKEGFKGVRQDAPYKVRNRFHSTKEGFKVCRWIRLAHRGPQFPFHQGRFQGSFRHALHGGVPAPFPFHQGRFQGRRSPRSSGWMPSFHSTKEGFKGPIGRHPMVLSAEVSIPPRKVSRKIGKFAVWHGWRVSIPPRKVSRLRRVAKGIVKYVRFHSTKEGFKAGVPRQLCHRPDWFPFHQGRFQGGQWVVFMKEASGFHSTKEGFKVPEFTADVGSKKGFPFHQGRFQGRRGGF